MCRCSQIGKIERGGGQSRADDLSERCVSVSENGDVLRNAKAFADQAAHEVDGSDVVGAKNRVVGCHTILKAIEINREISFKCKNIAFGKIKPEIRGGLGNARQFCIVGKRADIAGKIGDPASPCVTEMSDNIMGDLGIIDIDRADIASSSAVFNISF